MLISKTWIITAKRFLSLKGSLKEVMWKTSGNAADIMEMKKSAGYY